MAVKSAELRAAALGVLCPGFEGTELPSWLKTMLAEGLAGAWIFAHNVVSTQQVRQLCEDFHQYSDSALLCSDEEGGTVTRLDHAAGSPWPSAAAVGVVDDLEATLALAEQAGHRLAAAGIDLTAAPVADLNTEPDNPVIGVRSFGADAHRVAAHVGATVSGLAQAGVLSCVKHFPGHGATTQDSHVALPELPVSPATLEQRELVPFGAAVRAGVDTVMLGHLVVPQFGELPATLNSELVTLLRDHLGFTGVICTDAIDMKAVAESVGRSRAAVLAIKAGVDLVCVGNPRFPHVYDAEKDLEGLVDTIVASVHDGELAADRLFAAAEAVSTLRGRRTLRGSGGAPSTQLGLDVARRAITTFGPVVSLSHPVVVGASHEGNLASGARQEVEVAAICEVLGGERGTLTSVGDLVLVSDDHTDFACPDVQAALTRSAMIVHMGIRDLPNLRQGVVRTFGGGTASAIAAAEAILAKA